MESYTPSSRFHGIFSEDWAPIVLSIFAFLLPFLVVPGAVFPFQFSKVMLALIAVFATAVFFSVRALRSGMLSVVKSWLSLALLAVPLAYLASSIFSSVPSLSFFGYQLDQDTFGFMVLASALALVTTFAVTTEEKVLRVLIGLLLGAWVALLFQAIQIFFGVPLTFGVFSAPIQNLVGKWNDFGLFASLIASLSLLSLEALSLSSARRILIAGTLLVSLVLLALVNFALAWILLGIVAFMTLVFSFMRRQNMQGQGMHADTRSVASLIVLVLAVFFVFFGSGMSAALQSHFRITALEVSPSFQGTLGVLANVYAKSPFFGSGPNTFANDWLLARPAETLTTPFWATEFSSGVGFFPTSFATGGIVVAAAWLVLILLFVYTAVRALLVAPSGDERAYFLLVASALGSAFLLAAHFFYDPSQSLTLLLFLFLGLFIASLQKTPLARMFTISFSQSPRLGFLSVVGVAAFMLLSLVSLYAAGGVYVSSVTAANAVLRSNAGDLSGALLLGNQAASVSAQDRYLRNLTVLHLAQLRAILQGSSPDAKAQDAFQKELSQAILVSAQAVSADPLSYDNWMARAAVYEAVVPLGIQGASENATLALEEARKRNPFSPEVDYQEASMKALVHDTAGAKKSAQASLAKKADYTPAILLLAQLSLSEGNIRDAISSLESALVFTPSDSSLLYQLGLLQLQAKLYADAAASFNQAISITPDYANAKFFLGEADIFLGKTSEALALFKGLQASNSTNATLNDAISKLKAGKNPFANSTATLPPETIPNPAQ